MSRGLRLEPISAAAFAPFGELIALDVKPGAAANQGTADRFDYVATPENRRSKAKPNMGVFRCKPIALPFTIKLLERHPYSSQAFVPMRVSRFAIVVAPPRSNGEPDLAGLRAFVCGPDQGINYRPGVWHHPMIALDTVAQFFVHEFKDETAGDCEEFPLTSTQPLLVDNA